MAQSPALVLQSSGRTPFAVLRSRLSYEPATALDCQHRQYYDQNINRCKVHTVPGPLLRPPGSITYPENSVHASRSQFKTIIRPKRQGGIYDQVVGLISIAEFGKAITNYGIRDLFRYSRTPQII